MNSIRTFIYISGNEEYFQKIIILDKCSIRTKDIYFNLEDLSYYEKTRKKSEIKKEIDKVVSNNDVIVSSQDFSIGDAIITTGGIILGTDISAQIMKKASMKKEKRRKKISEYFLPGSYVKSYCSEYASNVSTMENLLEIHRDLLTDEFKGNVDTYIRLLNCLIQAPQPIKYAHYEEDVKKLLKEYPLS